MKLFRLLALILPAFSPLSATIIFTEVNNRITNTGILEYDLDRNGDVDWGLLARGPFFDWNFSVSAPTTTEVVTVFSFPGGLPEELAVLREGDIIGPSLSINTLQWNIGNAILLSGQFDNAWLGPFVSEVAYIGISFEREGKTHYAWALVEGGGPGTHRGVISYAWETEPGVPIPAGAIPEPSSTSLLFLGMFGILARRHRGSQLWARKP